ncbi:MAG: hypothetical protein OXM88_15710 [bacterium]|nr:hypothetical protein [bacterium]
MERRLLPVNALIALCNSGNLYPDTLKRSGYYVAGIEVPAVTDDGTVVIDVVMFHPERNVILAGEAKSGANVDVEQARRYGQLRADAVIQAASINVRTHGELRIQPLYCCPAENVVRVMRGLQVAGVQCPVLAFGSESIEHRGAPFLDLVIEEEFKWPIRVPGPPPRIIPVDDKSPDRLFDDLVLAALIAEMSKKRTEVMVPVLAAQAIPHLGVYAAAARNGLIRKVDSAVRRIAGKDATTFEYLGKIGSREYALIRFLRSPEDSTPQGRTQVYQAIRRPHRKRPQESVRSDGTQMKLFDEMADEFLQLDGMVGEEGQE